MKKIYLDHSATTPLDDGVFKAMLPYFKEKFGNTASIHAFGQEGLAAIDRAREQTARFFGCRPEEIIFTSGATESNNLAIKGLVKSLKNKTPKLKPHIITSQIEHDAVLEPFWEVEKEGAEATYLPVDQRGMVDVVKLESAIKKNTALVSIMYVNSEVGAIEPIREIGKSIRKINKRRYREWEIKGAAKKEPPPQPIYFHTDATQAVNFFNCDVNWHYLDLLSLSGHKIYGPKGVGALFVRSGTPLQALQTGGHHERNLRSGTLNTTGIAGLGAALAQLGRGEKGEPSVLQEKNNQKIKKLRDRLVEGIMKNIPDVILNTDRENATPAHAHFSFLGVEGESILISLDLAGIAVSTGSACASGSLKASPVLLAMGIEKQVAHNSIRFSLGKYNTREEINTVIKNLPPLIARLREMNPLYKKG